MKIARYLPRFQQAYRSFTTLEDREGWTRERIADFQLQRLNEVWTHAIAHVPYYRDQRVELSLPPQFESLAEFSTTVPVLQKMELRTRSKEFLSEKPEPGKWYRTSGSTNLPLSAFHGHRAHREMLRTKYRFYQMWGHDIFDPMVYLWNVSAANAHGIKGVVKRCREWGEDRLRNRMRLSALTLGQKDLQGYLRKIAAFKPSAIYSYSRAAYLLAQEAKRQGFRCPSLKFVNLTAEPASDYVVRTVEEGLGATCIVEYGCVELGFMAGKWPDRTLRVREDIMFVETLPREEGQYDLVLTNLNNPSFPLLRYDIGDMTDRPIERPERGFAILSAISGRCGDMLYSASGRCLYPTILDSLFEKEYYEFVRRYQIHQRVDYSLLVSVELHDPTRIPDTQQLAKHLSQKMEGCPVEVQLVDHIEQTAAGKHRNVISEVAAAQP